MLADRGVDESPTQPKDDVFFCFDLELPWDFAPTVVDGEVETFERMSVSEVARCVAYGLSADWPCLAKPPPTEETTVNAFKPNINLVVIDWLIRHGHVPPSAPGYLDLVASLRQGACC